jgi:hypothetical protein
VTDGAPAGDASARTPWMLYLGLAALTWGLFVPDQGLWHDDVQNLFRAFVAPQRGEGPFPVIATPTRRLLPLPFVVALATGWPVQALHLLSGLAWLSCGVLADRMAARLWPALPAAAPLAGVLTLCATSDFFTDAPLAVAYLVSIAAYLAATVLALRWLQQADRAALALSLTLHAAALWTTDAATAPALLAPLLFAAAPGGTRRRWVLLVGLWYAAAVPYFVVLLGSAAGGGYFRQALVPLGPGAWLRRFASLLAWNLTPWRWAFDRPLWYEALPAVVPWPARLGVAAIAGAAVSAIALRSAGAPAAAAAAGARGAVASVALMAASNAAFVSVHFSDLYCRTHLLSRVFAGLALAWLGAVAWDRVRGPGARAGLRVAVGAWVALGVAGALERQDYFVGYTRAHRQELASLLGQVPGLRPDARLLLRVPPHRTYMATEAGYLARAWTSLLHDDPSLECRTFLWSAHRPTSCVPAPGGLECRGERSPDCPGAEGRDVERLSYDRLVVLEYEPARNVYVLARHLPPEAGASDAYRPESMIVARPRTRLARALLDTPGGLAALLWP